MSYFLGVLGGVLFLIVLSYLITVGFVWVVLWLLGALFSLHFGFNVWLLGLLVWMLMCFIRSILGTRI